MSNDSKSPQDEKVAFYRVQSVVNSETRTVTVMGLQTVWVHELELALDAVRGAKSGDIELIARNLVEGATKMLNLASEIRARLKQ